tara:strand:- start:211 stop:648 length:438 start_codon:yes stop_codon:yes gene_type:complete
MTVYIKDLRGPNIKKALGAARVFKRYHNRNKSGGNFGINIHFAEYPTQKYWSTAVELTGDHDLHDAIYSLTFAPIYQMSPQFFEIGDEIITRRNYKTMTFEDLMDMLNARLYELSYARLTKRRKKLMLKKEQGDKVKLYSKKYWK